MIFDGLQNLLITFRSKKYTYQSQQTEKNAKITMKMKEF